MSTFDRILEQAEKLAGPGFHVSILVERSRPEERQLGTNGANSDQLIFNVKQVADMVGMSESTVRGWCKDGTLPATKMGRSWFVSREALDRLGSRGSGRLAN